MRKYSVVIPYVFICEFYLFIIHAVLLYLFLTVVDDNSNIRSKCTNLNYQQIIFEEKEFAH